MDAHPDSRLVRDYLDALKHQRRLSPATLANYRRALNLLFDLLGAARLSSLEPPQVRRFIAILHAKGLGPRSLALTLSAWRGCFRWLVRHRGFRVNPVLGIRAPRAPRPLPKALSVEAAQRLFREEKQLTPERVRDAAMFELLYSSGLRLAELAGLPTQAVREGMGILELAGLLAAAGRVACGDTGVAHLATALEKPSVVLFGPTPPALWGPPARRAHRALWKGRSSDPFADRPAPGLLAIRPNEVAAALAAL